MPASPQQPHFEAVDARDSVHADIVALGLRNRHAAVELGLKDGHDRTAAAAVAGCQHGYVSAWGRLVLVSVVGCMRQLGLRPEKGEMSGEAAAKIFFFFL